MYKNRKILCIIPARGGSKGVPRKNIKLLAGKPLIYYTIQQALTSLFIDRVIVSTDDKTIAKIALKYGAEVPFIRPQKLATDKSGTIDVLLHAINYLKSSENTQYDITALLHVTTPLRTTKDIDNCIKLLVDKNCDSVFSVCEANRNPYFNMIEIDQKTGTPRLIKKGNYTSRQQAPKVYDMNSSIYVWYTHALTKYKKTLLPRSRIYLMPKERSVDIDDKLDFKIAQCLMSRTIK